jgi:putative transposase
MDFFTVATLTFNLLYCFFVISHDRPRIVHFNVTRHPTSSWIVQQLREAFPYGSAPRFLLFDHDQKYGLELPAAIRSMNMECVQTSIQSPWQNAYAERLVGSIRRECLDHVMVFNEFSPRRILKLYFDYYHGVRTHLSLEKDAPEMRPVQPPEPGSIVELAEVGGLHHCHVPRAA